MKWLVRMLTKIISLLRTDRSYDVVIRHKPYSSETIIFRGWIKNKFNPFSGFTSLDISASGISDSYYNVYLGGVNGLPNQKVKNGESIKYRIRLSIARIRVHVLVNKDWVTVIDSPLKYRHPLMKHKKSKNISINYLKPN